MPCRRLANEVDALRERGYLSAGGEVGVFFARFVRFGVDQREGNL